MAPIIACYGCSSTGETNTNPKNSKKSSVKGDYKITTFGSSNLTPEEAMQKYIPKKKLKRGIDYRTLVKASDKAMDDMDYESGIVLANQAITMEPAKSKAYYLRGHGLYNSLHGSSKDALKDFLKAAELGDNDGRSYEYAARVYCDEGNRNLAIKTISKAVKINPKQRDYYKHRAAL